MIVLDSNIFVKLFIDEHDTANAQALIHTIQSFSIPVLLPSLFTYEIVQIGRYHNQDAEKVLDFLETQFLSNWQMREPTRAHWKRAQEISEKGNIKSGYPAVYDSIYHAFAIEGDGIFITADKKHYTKAASFERIFLLENWETPLTSYRSTK